MKVLLTRPFLEEDLQYLRQKIDPGITLIIPPSFNEQTLVECARDINVLLGGFITKKLIEASSQLYFIQIPWTGIDNLNFDLLKEFNLIVCNSHSNATVVAEHAVALMMDAAKKLSYHDRMLRQGNWNRISKEILNKISLFSAMITGSNVGIIGYGAIGRKIHKLLNGFDCNVTVISKDLDNIPESNDLRIFHSEKLTEGLRGLKIIFIAVPLTPETKSLVDESFIASLENDSILINISRGEVIEESTLYHALLNRRIAFAAIDTWFNYPTKETPVTFPSEKFEFHKLDNIVLSPHRAGYSEGGFPHLDDAIENINRCFNGKSLINVIDLNKKY